MTRRICDGCKKAPQYDLPDLRGKQTAQKYKGSPRISGEIVKIQTILRLRGIHFAALAHIVAYSRLG